ncbi:MAG: ribosomal 5S rRNA E-loop binding protein Ctc/L25/TL5, large subunit ribosomal protein L25 [Candidatus Peregrinibacteria bacterium GW2011_GWE2_39_6]|nr:MAG: ribosomal 5S rRNA E-loop binding protein Ctc/L25/TL5, large subunit ribosomal protein L25 [Candidatus Peregrinibacteria bacterium GW2011_GWF2_39_17]KKR25988.1 MAG: ribosomal 5S rRNA E-loop binding protein Ctc/L25/TL5, large subunit ribosomal protein L25 [Candidatus Peregrinibacteria bacterium GW2011_GWE2_39_6]HCW32814.1 50S ribosomal protein L25 [Candidatus Peregrinibacteria bacterium]
MDSVTLNALKRDTSLSAKQLRYEGFIPVEFYGENLPNQSLQIEYQTFRKVYIQAGKNTLVDLVVGEAKPLKVLIHDVQFEPVSGTIAHVDFINIRMDKEVHTNVPLEFIGESPAIKNLGGILMTNIDELEIKCLPKDLIHSIKVDISILENLHTSIHVKDLQVPAEITVLSEPEQVVVSVIPPRAEEEEPVATEAVVPEGEGAAKEGEGDNQGAEKKE